MASYETSLIYGSFREPWDEEVDFAVRAAAVFNKFPLSGNLYAFCRETLRAAKALGGANINKAILAKARRFATLYERLYSETSYDPSAVLRRFGPAPVQEEEEEEQDGSDDDSVSESSLEEEEDNSLQSTQEEEVEEKSQETTPEPTTSPKRKREEGEDTPSDDEPEVKRAKTEEEEEEEPFKPKKGLWGNQRIVTKGDILEWHRAYIKGGRKTPEERVPELRDEFVVQSIETGVLATEEPEGTVRGMTGEDWEAWLEMINTLTPHRYPGKWWIDREVAAGRPPWWDYKEVEEEDEEEDENEEEDEEEGDGEDGDGEYEDEEGDEEEDENEEDGEWDLMVELEVQKTKVMKARPTTGGKMPKITIKVAGS